MSNDGTNATIIERLPVNETHWIIRVKPDDNQFPIFEPGQYVELGIPDHRIENSSSKKFLRRYYSIASSVSNHEYVEFYLVAVEQGMVSPTIVHLPTDSRVYFGNKTKGKFTVAGVPENKNLLMIATGTGLAPYLSIYRSFHDQNRWKTMTIVHGVRYSDDLGYREELERLAKEDANFFYLPAITREAERSNWKGLVGRVTQLVKDKSIQQITGIEYSPENCHVFLCGNPYMVEALEEYCLTTGFKKHTTHHPGNLHFERYW
ncbi:MAG: ferredoxin--NADP reductase [Deltaproteobacteria bacterium]|nr:ferredoxin--NADP reductase [Deltaproteobacteria bacterium]